jgi:hypothetical protein
MMRSGSGRHPGAPGIESALDTPAIDIQGEQDVVNLVHAYLILQSPLDNVEILAAEFEVFNDRVEQRRRLEGTAEKAEIALIQLDPKRLTLKVLEPSMSQKPIPVLTDPHAYGHLAKITPCLLTLDPLELQGFFLPALVKALTRRGRMFHDGYRSSTL